MPPQTILHIPHASTHIPDDVRFSLNPDELERELLLMTDRYTDALFALPRDVAVAVAFPVSRLVVDPERFPDDAVEPMARKGMGCEEQHWGGGHRPAGLRGTAYRRVGALATVRNAAISAPSFGRSIAGRAETTACHGAFDSTSV